MSIKVSIIVPVYNKEHSIEKCINSLLRQSLKDIECIFVDDCSQDKSVEVIKGFSDERIKLICSAENQGPMCARACGYQAAQGKYIMFCDADDTIPTDGVQKLYDQISLTDSDIVIGNYCRVESDGSTHVVKNTFPFGKDKIGLFKGLLSWSQSQSLCDKIFDHRLFSDDLVALKGQRNGEDGWLLYQLIDRSNRIDVIDAVVYNYVMDESSTTHQRYSSEALERVIRSNVARVNIACKYKECEALASRHLIINKYRWLEAGYDKQFINHLIQKNMMASSLVSVQSLFRNFSLLEVIKLYFKTTVKRYYAKR